MAQFEFKCPQCGQAIEADDSICGQVAECPHCGKGIVVPRNTANKTSPKVQLRPVTRDLPPVPTASTAAPTPNRVTEFEQMARAEAKRNRIAKLAEFAKNIGMLLVMVAIGWGAWTVFKGKLSVDQAADNDVDVAMSANGSRRRPDVATAKTTSNTGVAVVKTADFESCKDKVIVIGNEGHGGGTAFLAKMDRKTYLFTNEHVARATDEFKRVYLLDGTRLELGAFEVAEGRDLVRFEVQDGLPAFELSKDTPQVDEQIAIYGNSAGKGAITEERGAVKAVGPLRLEVTARVVAGNSGSPVVNVHGEVIGVYTYVTLGDTSKDFDMLDSRYKDGRKWAIRFTDVKWIKSDWNEYCRQVALLEDAQEFCARLMPFLAAQAGKKSSQRFAYDLHYDELTKLYFRLDNDAYKANLLALSTAYDTWKKAESDFERTLRGNSEKERDEKRLAWQSAVKEFAGSMSKSLQDLLASIEKINWQTTRMRDDAAFCKEWIEVKIVAQKRMLKGVGAVFEEIENDVKEENKGTLLDRTKNCLAIVKAGNSMGSGFLVKMDGKIRFITNEHVARGGNPFSATLPDGTALRFEPTIEVAANRDLVRMTVIGVDTALELSHETPKEGTRIHVFGNSDGGGVLTSLHGTINGVGPDRIETAGCTFVSGNSGSAVINDMGEVLAVATYTVNLPDLEDRAKAQSRFNKVRWFSVRLNDVKWETISWGDYALRAKALNELELYEELCRVVCFRNQRILRRYEVLEWIERGQLTNRTLRDALIGVARADEAYLAFERNWNNLLTQMGETREHALNDPRPKIKREYRRIPSILKSIKEARLNVLRAGTDFIDGIDWKISVFKGDNGNTGINAKYYGDFFRVHGRRYKTFNATQLNGVRIPELPPSLKKRL